MAGWVHCARVTTGDDGADDGQERDSRRWASTEEVARAAGRSAVQVRKWSRLGLLPPYTTVNLGRGGRHARWPLGAVEQARRVAELFGQELTLDEILAELGGSERDVEDPEAAASPSPRRRANHEG